MNIPKNWFQQREAPLNWIAFGLLLAAWNASDRGATPPAVRRPEALRAYSHVSVRGLGCRICAVRGASASM